ncbi:MAG: class E sortase [Actinomycetota bacterium]
MRSAIRFIPVFGLVFSLFGALPVGAASAPDGVNPGSSRQPSFHRTQSFGTVVSHIRIPSIGVDESIRSGISLSVIDKGVAHWSGTSMPGDLGNVVLAGHRTTHSRPFWSLDKLDTGDLVYLTDASGFDVMYKVANSFVVDPDDLWISYDFGEPMVTMFACHPRGSARYRIVVQADLVAGRRIA